MQFSAMHDSTLREWRQELEAFRGNLGDLKAAWATRDLTSKDGPRFTVAYS